MDVDHLIWPARERMPGPAFSVFSTDGAAGPATGSTIFMFSLATPQGDRHSSHCA